MLRKRPWAQPSIATEDAFCTDRRPTIPVSHDPHRHAHLSDVSLVIDSQARVEWEPSVKSCVAQS